MINLEELDLNLNNNNLGLKGSQNLAQGIQQITQLKNLKL
jgi:hypothetical protein